MFYVYRKRDGRIISVSSSTPVIRAGGQHLVVELEQAIDPAKMPSYKIKDGELVKVRQKSAGMQARGMRERKAEIRDDKAEFWKLVKDKDSDLQDLRRALRILGRNVFPRGD